MLAPGVCRMYRLTMPRSRYDNRSDDTLYLVALSSLIPRAGRAEPEGPKAEMVFIDLSKNDQFAATYRSILIPHLASAKMLYGCDLAPYPTVRKIFETCMQIDAFTLAHPLQQADASKLG